MKRRPSSSLNTAGTEVIIGMYGSADASRIKSRSPSRNGRSKNGPASRVGTVNADVVTSRSCRSVQASRQVHRSSARWQPSRLASPQDSQISAMRPDSQPRRWEPHPQVHAEARSVMAKLIYSVIASADGYVEDAAGSFDWAAPDEELLGFVNDLERPVGTYLYGRRMYQTMLYWETAHTLPDQPPSVREFTRIWQAADKIVFSATLATPSSARTRVESNFDPATVRQLKRVIDHDMTVGGADLAGQALMARLVDELQLFVVPVLVGSGKRALPDGVRADLELLDSQRFASGVLFLKYRATPT